MPASTTNVMVLTLTPNKRVRKTPPELRVLTSQKEIILKADAANAADIEVSFVKTDPDDETIVKVDPSEIFVKSSVSPLPIKLGKGKEVRLALRPDLEIKKRGTFLNDHNDEFSRRVDLEFNFPKAEPGDHSDFHIEC